MKYKQGDILKSPRGLDIEILGVCGKGYLIQWDKGNCSVVADNNLDDGGYKLVEPEWKPEKDENYFVPSLDKKEFYYLTSWMDYFEDKRLLERGLVFKTKEEAIAKAKKMLEK